MEPASPPEALQAFAALMGPPGMPIDLIPAALAVARLGRPSLDPAPPLRQIRTWGGTLAERITGKPYPMQQVRALTTLLFKELGFTGNQGDYYEPSNSFLDDVIERRLGIPISLSVLTLGVGRSAGMPLQGIGFPGHFLVRYVAEDDASVLFDPFFGGEVLIEADCLDRLRAIYGPDARFDPAMIAPFTDRQVIGRMLTNLKGIYVQKADYGRALDTVDRLLIVDPARLTEHRDRGMLLLGLKRYPEAAETLRHYLDVETEAPDAGAIRRLLGQVQARYLED